MEILIAQNCVSTLLQSSTYKPYVSVTTASHWSHNFLADYHVLFCPSEGVLVIIVHIAVGEKVIKFRYSG